MKYLKNSLTTLAAVTLAPTAPAPALPLPHDDDDDNDDDNEEKEEEMMTNYIFNKIFTA
jgi:ribosomal protein L12E/L44/L45/RPP1/RPP2